MISCARNQIEIVKLLIEAGVDVDFPVVFLVAPSGVGHHRQRDAMNPGGERCIATKARQLTEDPDERLLHQFPSVLLIAAEAKGQPEDAIHMRVIQLARCDAVSFQHSRDERSFSVSRAWVEDE